MYTQNYLESAQKFNFRARNLQKKQFNNLTTFEKLLYVYIAISAHNSAQNFMKLNCDRAKKNPLLECGMLTCFTKPYKIGNILRFLNVIYRTCQCHQNLAMVALAASHLKLSSNPNFSF